LGVQRPYVLTSPRLEKVQNRFLHMLAHKYHKDLPLTMITTEFNIKSSEFRRQYSDLRWLYNLLNSKIDCLEMLSSIPLNVPNITLSSNPTFQIPTHKKKTIVFSLWLTDVYVGKKARNIWFFFDSLPRLKTCLKTLVLNNQ